MYPPPMLGAGAPCKPGILPKTSFFGVPCFAVDAFACGHTSHRGFKYCNVMRDGASQMIFCNFTKSRGAEEIVNAFTRLWNLNCETIQHPTY